MQRVGHGAQAEGAQAFDGGMKQHEDLLISGSSRGRGCWRGRAPARPAPAAEALSRAALQDGGDRGVGPGADRQSLRAGGIDPLGAIALDQPENADRRAEALLGMRPRAQDDVDQGGGVGADLAGLAADALMRPVAVAPMRTRHVLGHGGRPMRAMGCARCEATRLPRWKIFDAWSP